MRFFGFQAGAYIEIWIVAAAISMAAESPLPTFEGALPPSVDVPVELGRATLTRLINIAKVPRPMRSRQFF